MIARISAVVFRYGALSSQHLPQCGKMLGLSGAMALQFRISLQHVKGDISGVCPLEGRVFGDHHRLPEISLWQGCERREAIGRTTTLRSGRLIPRNDTFRRRIWNE